VLLDARETDLCQETERGLELSGSAIISPEYSYFFAVDSRRK
jgi:hypothetical protein